MRSKRSTRFACSAEVCAAFGPVGCAEPFFRLGLLSCCNLAYRPGRRKKQPAIESPCVK